MKNNSYDNKAMTSSSIIYLIDLPWVDILFRKILIKLDLKDLFNLRGTSYGYKSLVEEYLLTLKHLNLVRYKINTEAIKVLIQYCRNIQIINLSKCNSLNVKDINLIFKNNPKIHDVNLSHCNNIVNQVLHNAVLNCRNLNKINLYGCHDLTIGGLETLICHQNNIEYLDLSNCIQISENCIIKLVIKFYNIKYLSVRGIASVTDVAIIKMYQHFKCIGYLNVDDCTISYDTTRKLFLYIPSLKIVKAFGGILTYDEQPDRLNFKLCV